MNLKAKHQLWIEQYEAVQRSGLSITKWAIQNNLPASRISKRIRRLREMGLIPEVGEQTLMKSESSSSFVEITTSASTGTSTQVNPADIACRIELANRNAISIMNSISPSLLQKILEAVSC